MKKNIQDRWVRRPRSLAMLAVCLWLFAGTFAHGQQQQQVPAVRVDQLLNRLYPGNSGEIERRLATSATLAATPLPSNKPTATPAPLVIRLRRAQSADRATTHATRTKPAADRHSTRTTPTLVIPMRPDREEPKAPVVVQPPATRPAEPGDVSTYLSSLGPAAKDETTSASAAGKKGPAAVPLDLVGRGVNVNRANAAELVQALGIDVRRARLIIEFRTQQGRIRGPDDLAQVNGLTDDMIMKWEEKGLLRFE